MNRTRMFQARWRWVAAAAVLVLLVGLSLAGCGGEPAAVPTEPPASEATATKVAAQPTAAPTEPPPPTEVPPTATPTEEPTEVPPTATPTEEPTPEVADDSACVACHTNQEVLQAMAVEPEAPEVASEGEG